MENSEQPLLTRQYLKELGWKEKNGIMVLFSNPRLGWKDNGTLIIGYHEYPFSVTTIEKFNSVLKYINFKKNK